jgi:hypothetical protein
MDDMRRFGIVGLLFGALLLGGVGIVAYQAGVTAGTTSAAVAGGATVVYHAPWAFGFGFPLFGLLFGLLFLGLLFALIRRVAWGSRGGPGGPGGPGGHPGHGWGGPWAMKGWGGPGGWSGEPGTDRPVPPPVAEMLGRWHAQAHEATPSAAPPAPGATSTTSSSAAGTPAEPGPDAARG